MVLDQLRYTNIPKKGWKIAALAVGKKIMPAPRAFQWKVFSTKIGSVWNNQALT
jgi:hypothetical protein